WIHSTERSVPCQVPNATLGGSGRPPEMRVRGMRRLLRLHSSKALAGSVRSPQREWKNVRLRAEPEKTGRVIFQPSSLRHGKLRSGVSLPSGSEPATYDRQ